MLQHTDEGLTADLQSTLEELRHEARMMSRVCNHDNVVQFVGVVVEPRPAVVTKFMRCGSLEDVLVKSGARNRR